MTDDRWLLLEQPGPWGPKVPQGAGLDQALAAELAARCEALGIRLALLRRTVAREDVRPRTAFLACTRRGATLGRAPRGSRTPPTRCGSTSRRSAPDARPTRRRAGRATSSPCARTVSAIPAARAWAGRCTVRCSRRARTRPGRPRTWAAHRFAPTLLHLPSGICLGRVPAARAREVAAALEAGRVPVELLRGRVGDPWAVQAADALVRAERGLDGLDDVDGAGGRGRRRDPARGRRGRPGGGRSRAAARAARVVRQARRARRPAGAPRGGAGLGAARAPPPGEAGAGAAATRCARRGRPRAAGGRGRTVGRRERVDGGRAAGGAGHDGLLGGRAVALAAAAQPARPVGPARRRGTAGAPWRGRCR